MLENRTQDIKVHAVDPSQRTRLGLTQNAQKAGGNTGQTASCELWDVQKNPSPKML